MRALLCCGALSVFAAACVHRPPAAPSPPSSPQAVGPGHGIGIYKLGQPYQVNGIWYYPQDDLGYSETGIASWYGPDFHEKFTANGEIFDQNEVSAAHKTLPLPSVVQVTNLDNGRTLDVRVNDRGPFVASRIIDLSYRAAQLLGFDIAGTAKVRVRLLVPESIQAQSIAKLNGSDGSVPTEPAPPAVTRPEVVAEVLPPLAAARQSPPRAITSAPPVPVPPAPPPPAAAAPPGPLPKLPETVTVLPVNQTHIFIQAGAYASTANADKMRQRLASVGPAAISSVRVNGMSVFRVRLGPLASVADADAMLARALGAGAAEAKIVVE